MEILKDRYTITELSERLNITDHALRYYEKEFRLSVPKDERGRRYYTADLANVMYQIKNMRDDGLEIKAIKRILESENIVNPEAQIVIDDTTVSMVPSPSTSVSADIRQFFNEFKSELTTNITAEVALTREQLSREINKTKLELGACVENSSRKLEAKLDKHFQEVDRSLARWRDRKKGNILRRIFNI